MLAGVLQNAGHDVMQRYGHILGVEHVLRGQDADRTDRSLQIIRSATATITERYWARTAMEEISRQVPQRNETFFVERNNVRYVSGYLEHNDSDDIAAALEAVRNRERHLFYDYFAAVEVPFAERERPDVYGISIADERQLIPGLVLASMIRDALPGTLLVLGGNFWPRVVDKTTAQAFAPLFTLCDGIVYAEGFQPLLHIADTRVVRQAPGTAWLDGDEVRLNPKPFIATSFDQLPVPVFDRAVQQWAPEFVPTLYTMSNCPQRCGFCAISAGSDTFLGKARGMSPSLIADHLQQLGVHRADFADETYSCQRQLALGRELQQRGYNATWQVYLTAVHQLADPGTCSKLYEAGCRGVQLGLESLHRETLDDEDKRWNNPELYGRILSNLAGAGIQVHVFIIAGLPTEPDHITLRWLPFLEDNGDAILTIKSGRYRFTKQSPEQRGDLHSALIEPSGAQRLLHLNEEFRYRPQRGGDRSRIKDVEALRELLEEACRRHWAYEVTSTLPWWINRGRYSLAELRTLTDDLRVVASTPVTAHLNRAVARTRTILPTKEGGEIPTFSTMHDLTAHARTL